MARGAKMNNEVNCDNPECRDGKIGYGLNDNVIKPCPDCTDQEEKNDLIIKLKDNDPAKDWYNKLTESEKTIFYAGYKHQSVKLKQQAEEIESNKAFLSYYSKKITELKEEIEQLNKEKVHYFDMTVKLKEQIESMKCCGNCGNEKYYYTDKRVCNVGVQDCLPGWRNKWKSILL